MVLVFFASGALTVVSFATSSALAAVANETRVSSVTKVINKLRKRDDDNGFLMTILKVFVGSLAADRR